jgi:hypothetical protein
VVFHLLKSPPNAVIGEETWVYGYDIETKKNLHTGRVLFCFIPRKHNMRSLVKVVLLVSFDHRGIVHYEFAPEC